MEIQKYIDWFLDKNAGRQVIVIILLVTVYLGYNYWNTQSDLKKELISLREKVIEQDGLISSLEKEVQNRKFKEILMRASDDASPVPEFIVDIKDYKIIWVNKAYEKKYLLPKFTNREEFIGTDGSYVFGEDVVINFHRNNKLVFLNRRPMTFDEVGTTILKYPISVGDYTYAIRGIEYLIFK